MIKSKRPLRPEDLAVLERISFDLERSCLLAQALAQPRLASEFRSVLASVRRIIAGETEDTGPSEGDPESGAVLFSQPEGNLPTNSASFLASLLYLAADVEPISPPAADLCRAAAELIALEQGKNQLGVTELEAG